MNLYELRGFQPPSRSAPAAAAPAPASPAAAPGSGAPRGPKSAAALEAPCGARWHTHVAPEFWLYKYVYIYIYVYMGIYIYMYLYRSSLL